MIVTAFLDLSEGGRKPALPEGRTPVALFHTNDNFDLDGAFAAITRCRLIREGHVFTTEIAHGVNYAPLRDWVLDEHGEVVPG